MSNLDICRFWLAAWLELEIPEPTILTGKILKNAHFSFYHLPTILWSAFWFQKKSIISLSRFLIASPVSFLIAESRIPHRIGIIGIK